MRGMHANANLAYVLGAAARFEATGEARARDAVLAFWRHLHSAYTYATSAQSHGRCSSSTFGYLAPNWSTRVAHASVPAAAM